MEDVTEAMINCDSLKGNQQSLILKHSPQLSIQKYMSSQASQYSSTTKADLFILFLPIFLSESFRDFKALFILEES